MSLFAITKSKIESKVHSSEYIRTANDADTTDTKPDEPAKPAEPEAK